MSINELIEFCKIWRTRKEIKEEFDLSPVASWHLVKRVAKYKSDFMIEKRQGKTGRAIMYKARLNALKELGLI